MRNRGALLRGLQIFRRLRKNARMSRSEMLEHQLGLFRDLLRYVWPRSAYYRELYSHHGIREADLGEVKPTDLPMVDKRQLREHFDDVVTDAGVQFQDVIEFAKAPKSKKASLRRYEVMLTSGTTGEPTFILHDQRCWAINQVAFAVRLIHRRGRRRWVHRRAYLGGALTLGAGSKMTLDRPWFSPRPLIISPQLPTAEIVQRLNAFQPTLLTGFSSEIAVLAREALGGRLRINPEVVGTSGENLTPGMEDDLEDAWPGRHINAFSASEALCVAARRYRKPFSIFDDLNLVEVVGPDGSPAPEAGTGDMLLTNLHNRIMPIVRYRTGDVATALREPESGPFSLVDTILGRAREFLPALLDDGTVGRIPAIAFSGFVAAELRQFKVVLTAPDLLEFQYVATVQIDGPMEAKIQAVLRNAGASLRMRYVVTRVSALSADPKTNKVRTMEVRCDLEVEGA